MDSNADINNIKKEIYPLYAEMLSELRHILEKINTRVFCFQWGKYYPFNKDDGILFVGKATNGWISNSINADELFDINNEKGIFAINDQIKWVNDTKNNNNGYNSNKSAFWRVVRSISNKYYNYNR